MTFDERKEWLQNEHEALITRKNEPIEGNGVYERYKYPIDWRACTAFLAL